MRQKHCHQTISLTLHCMHCMDCLLRCSSFPSMSSCRDRCNCMGACALTNCRQPLQWNCAASTSAVLLQLLLSSCIATVLLLLHRRLKLWQWPLNEWHLSMSCFVLRIFFVFCLICLFFVMGFFVSQRWKPTFPPPQSAHAWQQTDSQVRMAGLTFEGSSCRQSLG